MQTHPDLHLVLRVQGHVLLCPRWREAPPLCFVLRVHAPFGSAHVDDLVEVELRVACEATNELLERMDMVVCDEMGRTYGLVQSTITEFTPRVRTSRGTCWVRISSATRRHFCLVGGGVDVDGTSATDASLPLQFAFSESETPAQRRLAALRTIYERAKAQRTQNRPLPPTRAAAALREAPRSYMRDEVDALLSRLETPDAVADFVAWHEFYVAGDATHVLLHVLRARNFTCSEQVAEALEFAADSVRAKLLRASASSASSWWWSSTQPQSPSLAGAAPPLPPLPPLPPGAPPST